MQNIRTQDGRFFGWTSEDGLFNRDGQHVGQIYRGIIYDEAGLYLGEVRGDRLITDILRKDTHRWYGYFPNMRRVTGEVGTDGPALPMPVGYEEFPSLLRSDSLSSPADPEIEIRI